MRIQFYIDINYPYNGCKHRPIFTKDYGAACFIQFKLNSMLIIINVHKCCYVITCCGCCCCCLLTFNFEVIIRKLVLPIWYMFMRPNWTNWSSWFANIFSTCLKSEIINRRTEKQHGWRNSEQKLLLIFLHVRIQIRFIHGLVASKLFYGQEQNMCNVHIIVKSL